MFDLGERLVDLLQCVAKRADQRLDLAPLGRDLAGVGETLVVRAAVDPELAKLVGDPVVLGRQLGAPIGFGGLRHGGTLPRYGVFASGRPARVAASKRARGCAASYTARSRSGDTFVYTWVVEMLA